MRYYYLATQRGAAAEDIGVGSVPGRSHRVLLGYIYTLVIVNNAAMNCFQHPLQACSPAGSIEPVVKDTGHGARVIAGSLLPLCASVSLAVTDD